jgi:hypothetical protein
MLASAGSCAFRMSPYIPATPVDFKIQLSAYVEVQEALAADNFEVAKAELEEFARITDTATQALAEQALRAGDIEELRTSFKPLSESLVAQDLPQGFAKAYCPMYDSGASWIQRDGPVRNPYYGALMLSCGVVDDAVVAHMDHSAQHGGTVFMAPDGFHHIEGVYPEPGLFRLYATNNYRKSINVSDWSGRVVTEEVYDSATDEFLEVSAVGLVPGPGGDYLQARFPDENVAAEVIAKVLFQDDFPPERFDFIFAALTIENTVAPTTGATFEDAPVPVPLSARILPDIPDDAAEIAAEIMLRDQQIEEMISLGKFTEIFIPALQAKELGLALQSRDTELSLDARNQIRIAVRHLVRSAYLLDWYGDRGNKNNVDAAFAVFRSTVGEINAVFEVTATP